MLLTTEEFLAKIDRFLDDVGMTDGDFGRTACNNTKFLVRLRAGVRRGTGSVKLDMANYLTEWMREYKEHRREERKQMREAAREAREARRARKTAAE